jgi:ketosteroid isomerase-like protein
MASPNLELVRSIYAGWERGEFTSAEWADPEIEVVFTDGPTAGTWSGIAGFTEAWRDFLSTWERGLSIVVDEYRQVDDERVLVLGRLRGRGKMSGLELREMRTELAALYHVREGKVTRQVFYWDRERALADAGLAPEAN